MSSTSSIAKLALLATTTILQSFALSPPNPQPAKVHRDKFALNAFASAVGSIYIPAVFKLGIWLYTFLESAVIICPDHFSHRGDVTKWGLQDISIPFLAGCGLVAIGSLLRLYCYRILGEFFTFQLALLPGHKLMKHGPYAVVRHPSYTAIMTIALGFPLVYQAEGSLLYLIWGPGVMKATYTFIAGVAMILGKRAGVEDEVLKAEFGKEWEGWAQSVRWKIFPGIF